MKKMRTRASLLWGIILILLGLTLLLQTFDIDIWNAIVNLWPVILIVWGGWKIYLGIIEKRETKEAQK